MNCRKAQKLLPAMAAGELPDSQARALREHLEACASCAAELRAYEESLAALKRSRDRELPEGTWNGYWKRIRDEAVIAQWERTPVVRISFRRVMGFAAAAAVLVAGLVGWSLLRQGEPEPKEKAVQPLMAQKQNLEEGEQALRVVRRIDSPIYTLNDMARQVRGPEQIHLLPDLGKGTTPNCHYTLKQVKLADKDESKYEF